MGYYVITDPEKSPMEAVYVAYYKDLAKVDGLTKNSVICVGSRENRPEKVGESVLYRNLGESWYRAGFRAQQTFARMARRRGWVLEELSQDPESFRAYSGNIQWPVKRGDFLIRNLHNLEVEVKCRTFYGSGSQRYFYFAEEDLEKHLNMQYAAQTPVIIAIYRRKEDVPVSSSLCMIQIDRIRELASSLVKEHKNYGWVYRIPLRETLPGFELLGKYVTDEITPGNFEEGGREKYKEGRKGQSEVYVMVAYCKSREHLAWVLKSGWYNLRMGTDRGALQLGEKETGVRYLLLHRKEEKRTGNLFKIVESGPRIFSKEALINQGYPGTPAHNFYLVYRVTPVLEKELTGRSWDISRLDGYKSGHGTAFPFVVTLSELMNEDESGKDFSMGC